MIVSILITRVGDSFGSSVYNEAVRTSHHLGFSFCIAINPSLNLCVFSVIALDSNLEASILRSDVKGIVGNWQWYTKG